MWMSVAALSFPFMAVVITASHAILFFFSWANFPHSSFLGVEFVHHSTLYIAISAADGALICANFEQALTPAP